MTDTWLEIACDVPEEYSDVVADFLTQLTGNGVCVDNQSVDAFSVSEIPDTERVIVKAYLSADGDSSHCMAEVDSFITGLSNTNPSASFNPPLIVSVNAEDWSTSWKKYFTPLRVGKRILIVPTWEEAVLLPDDLVIRIDPGMAFGTGGHETTRLCLEILESVIEQDPLLTFPSLLDLGTGSGILAMAANLLGAGRILALDIDADAIDVARANISLNEMTGRIDCGTSPLESLTENFDIILANILAEELVRLAHDLTDRLIHGGALILSGILAEKENLVRQGFNLDDLRYCETVHAGEWVAMLYRKEGEQ
ncbi:MAG: 50S ribosomal protein L11 methyltransferase [Desulfuromonadaceae bacterium]|nr:50S ribosomal protein L11 methyltransferase [Desulfuromonadaceae bacterium]MDD5107407.1 50S ribosomal protein L11 methyltransferase [Desulfuromonadaceae bacterium]